VIQYIRLFEKFVQRKTYGRTNFAERLKILVECRSEK